MPCAIRQGADDGWVCVSQNQRGGVVDEVEPDVAVDVGDVDAGAALGVDGEGIDMHARACIAAGQ